MLFTKCQVLIGHVTLSCKSCSPASKRFTTLWRQRAVCHLVTSVLSRDMQPIRHQLSSWIGSEAENRSLRGGGKGEASVVRSFKTYPIFSFSSIPWFFTFIVNIPRAMLQGSWERWSYKSRYLGSRGKGAGPRPGTELILRLLNPGKVGGRGGREFFSLLRMNPGVHKKIVYPKWW